MDYSLELITQKPIYFNGIKIIQPTLNTIIDDFGMEKYNEYLLPFIIDLDFFNISDELKEQYNITNVFDIFILDNNISLLLNSINVFCDAETISLDTENKRLYIGDNSVDSFDIDSNYLDSSNFNDFADIILKINSKTKPQKEIPPKNMTAKQKDIWDKLQAGRKRHIEKSQINLTDLINTCEFGGDYYVPMSNILNWTLWNISRCYQTILGKSNYKDAFSVYCVTGEKDLIKKHWSDLISIDDKEQNTIKI